MLLVTAQVGPFRSISTTQTVGINEDVTVLVGMNESGKTVFLRALEKSNDALELASFDPIEDFPRKDLSAYLKKHPKRPAIATCLTYRLDEDDCEELNGEFATEIPNGFEFLVSHRYDNRKTIALEIDETPALKKVIAESGLSTDALRAVEKAAAIREIPDLLAGINLTDQDKLFVVQIQARLAKNADWSSIVQWEVWKFLEARIPQFLYFNEYDLLPSKVNLTDLANRVDQAKIDAKRLAAEHRAVLALLRMAEISIADCTKSGGYESLKARIEAVSISLTDQIMEFWKQNEELDVEVDIKADPEDDAPFNVGPNLYLRIKNRRHRGVSTPFAQRSRGFIWFFSFLVWFDSVQHQVVSGSTTPRDLILLLDEPGLALHALAQSDFLHYIDDLSEKHQVLYTTHSPFMVHSDRLVQVRVVEDRKDVGTVITEHLGGSDPRAIFPLQAALGWTIAQNLFISERNLLVEGPADLIYLQIVSGILEAAGRVGLRDDVTIVPVGGLDKVATFVALLGASGLKLAVLHDYRGAPEQALVDLARQKMIAPKAVLNASQFRDVTQIGQNGRASDTEDLFAPDYFIQQFNGAFAGVLKGTILLGTHLPPGDRIVDRIERHLQATGISTRPSGGFNHYTVSSYVARNPPATLDPDTLTRFKALFDAVNKLF